MNKEQNLNTVESQQLNIADVSDSALRTYAQYCPNCGTTAKLDTQKYCSDECKNEYKAKLARKFS